MSQRRYDSDNIFAKIIRGQLPCNKVYEDDLMLAFDDITKAAPVHVLVVPKGEFVNFGDFASNAGEKNVAHFFKKIKEIAEDLGLKESGYRLITNNGSGVSQTVPHFHVHILGGKRLSGLLPRDKEKR